MNGPSPLKPKSGLIGPTGPVLRRFLKSRVNEWYRDITPVDDSFVLKYSGDRTLGQEPEDTGGSTGEAVATQNPRIKLAQDAALPFWIASLVLPRLERLDASTAYRLLPLVPCC